MSAAIIDGRAIAEEIKRETGAGAAQLKASRGIVPGLAFLLIGENPASQAYVRMKGKACDELGYYSVTERRPDTVSEKDVLALISGWNADPRIHGILVQLPLPKHLNEAAILESIDFRKDVDGFHPVNAGLLIMGRPCLRPCTPAGVQELLVRSGNDPSGKHVVIVGRSNIVGKPLASILMQKQRGANAVVTVAHTGAADIAEYTKRADIVVAAIGKASCITGAMLKPGAVVIDVGINRVDDPAAKNGYRLVGDVEFASASAVARAITPVPGGVGPMTIALLMRNTLQAAGGAA